MAVLPPKRPSNKPSVDDPLLDPLVPLLLEPPPINPARLPRPPRPEQKPKTEGDAPKPEGEQPTEQA